MSYRENTNQQNLLNQFLTEHGVQLSEDVLGKLYDFADLVVETKQFGNLISAKDSEKFLSRHIADSLVPYIYIRRENGPAVLQTRDEREKSSSNNGLPSNNLSSLVSRLSSKRWADMGAGAGCPVFPLAIVMPEIQFYAVEPRHMRVEFMNYAKEKLQLSNLTVVGKNFAGNLNPGVIFALPVSQPFRGMQARKSSGPAARWMAPSTPPPPRREQFAALTIASTSSFVISPWIISISTISASTIIYIVCAPKTTQDFAMPYGSSN